MEELQNIKKAVFLKRPVLEGIYRKFGNLSLNAYVKTGWEFSDSKPNDFFLGLIKNKVKLFYGAEAAENVVNGLIKKPLVSTIDHLGLLGHPIFLNSDLIYSLHFNEQEHPLILATESVSLNNTSSWSASFLWHEKNLQMRRAAFLTDKFKTHSVFSAPAITQKDAERFNTMSQHKFSDLVKELDLNNKNFSVQACKGSYMFWKKIFPNAPRLVFLPLETLVSEFLIELLKTENIFSKLVESSSLWKKYFNNERTYLFWGIDKKGRRIILDNVKVGKEEIMEMLKNRSIYPSSPLCFCLMLYAGFACVGGFNQTSWLTEVKDKFENILQELGEPNLVKGVPTRNFSESSLARIKISQTFVEPSLPDLFLRNENYYTKYSDISKKLTLSQSLDLLMPEIYNIAVPKPERIYEFKSEVLQSRIFEELGLKDLYKGV